MARWCSVEEPTQLKRSDRAWTVLELAHQEGQAQPGRRIDDETVAEAMVGLLTDRNTVRRVWRVGPGGVLVAATEGA